MSDIAAFIAARLDEDEAVIKAMDSPDAARDVVGLWSSNLGQETYLTRYLAQFDPLRMLREVAALRAIVAEHAPVWDDYVDGDDIERATYECDVCAPPGTPDNWPCRTVRHVASIWAGHPDYDLAWRPETPEGPPA